METALDLRTAIGQRRAVAIGQQRVVTNGEDSAPLTEPLAGAGAPEAARAIETERHAAAGRSDEAGLVAAAQAGDRVAFGRLHDGYARMVHGILLAWAPRSEVDDLAQDVFLQAMRRLGTLRDEGAFGPWIARIARNRARDFHRTRPTTEDLPENLTGPDWPVAEAFAALEAIKGLPEAYRQTLMLRLVEGMTGPEIAARTGLTPESVRVNLHRGMAKLREKLGRRDAHE